MQKILFATCVVMSIFTAFLFMVKTKPRNVISYNLEVNSIDNMPLVGNDPFATVAHGGTPIEQREVKFRKWLSAGVKIRVSRAIGSGTIVYYDPKTGWAYVQSCGHFWNGNMTADQSKRKRYTCKVIVWYHNNEKLAKPKEYRAHVLYFSNSRGRDISLLRFKPDWQPNYFPIAPENFQFKGEMTLHSVGCDSGNEVAHYNVRHIGFRDTDSGWNDLVTTQNSPRPGRSGGGLMSDNYFVGICWGTSNYDGSGNGYFTPLSTIREYNKRNGFGWLNEVGFNWARMIPIVDRNNPQGDYPENYIPLPKR